MRYTLTITTDDPAELARIAGFLADQTRPATSTGPPAGRPREPGEDDPEPEHRPPPVRRSEPARTGNGRYQDSAPRTGKQFAGWIYKQSPAIKQDAKGLAVSRGYPTMWTQLSPNEVQDLYHELTAGQPEPASREWGGRR